MYGYETWILTLKEGNKLKEEKIKWRNGIYTERFRDQSDEVVEDIVSESNTIGEIKSSRLI